MLSYTSLTFFGPVQTAGKGGGIARKLQTCQVYKPLKWQLLGVPSPADVLHERMPNTSYECQHRTLSGTCGGSDQSIGSIGHGLNLRRSLPKSGAEHECGETSKHACMYLASATFFLQGRGTLFLRQTLHLRWSPWPNGSRTGS